MNGEVLHSPQIEEANGSDEAGARDGSYFVQSLARGLEILRLFGRDAESLSLAEVAQRAGMSRAAARRYLLTLRDLGYVAVQGSRFSLRPRLLELGYAYLSSLSLWQVSQPILEELVAKVGESCSVSVLDPPDIVYVARVQVRRIIGPTVSVGTRFPAVVTAAGRVMLAAAPKTELERILRSVTFRRYTEYTVCDAAGLRALLPQIRQQGHAIVDQELEIGLASIAVPIRDRSGKVIAALTGSLNRSTIPADAAVQRLLPHLKSAAAEITANLP